MKYHFKILLLVILPLIATIFVAAFNKDSGIEFKPEKGQKVIILGNTFAERLQYFNYFEPLLYKSFPDLALTVRNLGWSADEVSLQPRPYNFGTLDEHLSQQKADIIFACFGLNEAFKGPDSLMNFKHRLSEFLLHLKQQKYNSVSSPKIILISPIAHEKLGGNLPDPAKHNANLKLYTNVMAEVAKQLIIPFINLYEPTRDLESATDSLTINGIHLNDKGYKAVSEIIAGALNFKVSKWKDEPDFNELKKTIDYKNQQFFYKFRAVNAEYINGSRKEPWVQPAGGPVYFSSEFKKLDQMVLGLDSMIWAGSRSSSGIDSKKVQRLINNSQQIKPKNPQDVLPAPLDEQFVVKEGYKIELFASEKDFPIEKPVKITFDPKGRLWVSTLPSYPQYYPGSPPNDKIIILEDTDKDGKADKHTVFADSLYLPLGFELGNGGVYVTQPPNLMFLKDTDGDGKADVKQIILHGFGTEDSHHSISAHTWGPDGALYMHAGTFLHTQVETPYGPQRSAYGETWRYEPLTMKLEPYISYPYANPWGNIFTRNGTHLIGDVSTGMNYFAPPLTVATDYPVKHVEMKDILTLKIKPKTCGMEIISSRNFPDNCQGNILFNTFIGFQGITQHSLTEEGSGLVGRELEPLLQSKDPQFRPVDLQFGPDGALYLVDWFNIVINHGERALRDPNRDQTHGRIWRITYTGNKIVEPVDMSRLNIDQLLDQLKVYEDRARYRARIQLTEFPQKEILIALPRWIEKLDSADKNYEQYLMEALWVYQQLNKTNETLLNKLLKARDANIRAAATRVLFYRREEVNNSQARLIAMSKDPSPRVRLEAIVSLSHFKNEATLMALLAASELPTDDYIEYALKESFKHLQTIWMSKFKKDKNFLSNDPQKASLLLQPLSSEKVLAMPGYFKKDPDAAKYTRKPLSAQDYDELADVKAVVDFKQRLNSASVAVEPVKNSGKGRNVIHLSTVSGKMAYDKLVINISSGSLVSLVFSNPDEMPHNVVIVKPGSMEIVGKAADAMASLKDGYAKNFVPAIPEVLYSTPLIATGGTFKLDFKAPDKPGEYPFICTFPGHWRVMKGVIKVN
ncbi:MAG: HEAT repeat domain-containing protein [Phormidesmis sp. FL-bin-119]|nr:HEAT repeat domain-containing protein [Pedobacter sp.]